MTASMVNVWSLGAVLALGGMASAEATAEDLKIVALGLEKTITCDERAVVIEGASNRLTLRGRCERVSIHGTDQVVHVERLGRADMDGLENRLEWEQALRGNRPAIRDTGVNNRALRVEAAAGADPDTAPADEPSIAVESGESRVVVGGGGISVEGGSKRRGEGGVRVRAGGVAVDASGTASLKISGSDVEQAHDCAGGSALVEGSDNRLTLTRCPVLTVTGGGNHIVLVGPVRRIRLLGGENEVQWSEGEGGRPPKIETPGSDNHVVRK